jgi:hypothetical protein
MQAVKYLTKNKIYLFNFKFLSIFILFSLLFFNNGLNINASFSIDLKAETISYLGTNSTDRITSTAVQSTGHVLIAGSFTGLSSTNQYNLNGATNASKGSIIRLSKNTKQILSITRLGDNVDQIAIDPNTNEILAYNQSGLFKLSSDASSIVWSKTGGDYGRSDRPPVYSSGRRLSVAKNGDVAVLGNIAETSNTQRGFAYIVSSNGTELGKMNLLRSNIGGGTYNERWEDIAIDNVTKQIFVTGFAQRCPNYQSPFVMAYSYQQGATFGQRNWLSYNLWCSEATNLNLGADSRGKRVDFKNGDLLFVGKADGGNNRFTRMAPNGQQATNEVNRVQLDSFNNGAGFGSGAVGFFARMNPVDGTARKTQFQYSRQDLTGSNNARSFEINAINMDDAGNVIIAGQTFRNIPKRNELTINGQPIGSRVDNETAILSVNKDFNQRVMVSSLTGLTGAGAGSVTDLASNNGLYVATGFTSGQIMTRDSISSFGSGGRPFFAVWGTFSGPDPDPLPNPLPDPSPDPGSLPYPFPVPPSKVNKNELIITEINWASPNPVSQDQWIEVYNNSGKTLELDDLILYIQEKPFYLVDHCNSLTVDSNQFFLISKHSSTSKNSMLNTPTNCVISTLNLSPNGEKIELFSTTRLVDKTPDWR